MPRLGEPSIDRDPRAFSRHRDRQAQRHWPREARSHGEDFGPSGPRIAEVHLRMVQGRVFPLGGETRSDVEFALERVGVARAVPVLLMMANQRNDPWMASALRSSIAKVRRTHPRGSASRITRAGRRWLLEESGAS